MLKYCDFFKNEKKAFVMTNDHKSLFGVYKFNID